jgi:hypothetical protein
MRMATAVVAQPATAGNDIVGNAQLLWERFFAVFGGWRR